MKRRGRTWWATDEEYAAIVGFARTRKHSVSQFLRDAAAAEIRKRIPRDGLQEAIEPLVELIVTRTLEARGPYGPHRLVAGE